MEQDLITTDPELDRILREAEARGAEANDADFNETNEDYTIVFGRSYRYEPD